MITKEIFEDHQSRFLTEAQRTNGFAQAKQRLNSPKPAEQQAAREQLTELLAHDPYEPSAHLALAYDASRRDDLEAFTHHLSICYDLDSSLLESWQADTALQGLLDVDVFHTALEQIEKDKLRREWNVIDFFQVSPQYQSYEVNLCWKDEKLEGIEDFYASLPPKVDIWIEMELDTWDVEIAGPHITLKSNADRRYCFYGHIHQSIRRLAAHVQDARFFMSTESEEFLDEFWCYQGECYFLRHPHVGYEKKDTLLFLEKLLEKVPHDQSLHDTLAEKWADRATFSFDLHLRDPKLVPQDEVEESLQKALHYDPNSAQVAYISGRLQLHLGHRELAYKSLQRTRQLDPYHFDALFLLGKLYFEDEEYACALKSFDDAAKKKVHYHQLQLYRGMTLSALGRPKEAKEAYLLDIQHTPDYNSFTLNQAGYILIKRQEYVSARLYFDAVFLKNQRYRTELEAREAKDTSPSSSSFYVQRYQEIFSRENLAWQGQVMCAHASGDFQSAWRACEAWRKHDPSAPAAQAWHATLSEEKERKSERASAPFGRDPKLR